MTLQGPDGGLPPAAAKLFERLAELGIATTTTRHPPLRTVEESRRLRGDIPGLHCKTLFLKDKKGRLWLLVAGEDREIDLKAVAARVGAGRLSFASAELLGEVLGVTPGAVTPFALINDASRRVAVILDSQMLDAELLNYHPLTNAATTTIAAADLQAFIAACGHPAYIVSVGAEAGAATSA